MKNQNIINSTFLLAAVALTSGVAVANQALNLTDTNGDGVISAEEITIVRDAQKAEMLTQFDADGNGELSRDERRSAKDARHTARLTNFDADGDGELSRDERQAAKESRRAAIDSMLDVNGDGEVSAEESAGYEQVKDERGGHKKRKRGEKSLDI